jgi:hypothetical protein|tara:strand:- start:8854 stop:9258 length:405 start_codon:yes stop_codon:yes gene_type:complete
MQKKTILVATFVQPEKLEKLFNTLYNEYSVKRENVFIFETESNGLLLTYRINLNLGQKIDLRKNLSKTTQVHKKKKTFFTINALNKLIEEELSSIQGNIDHKQHDVDWNKYEDKIILLKNGKLDILNLKRKNIE